MVCASIVFKFFDFQIRIHLLWRFDGGLSNSLHGNLFGITCFKFSVK